MAQYDEASKYIMLGNAESILRHFLNEPDLRVLSRLDTALPTLQMRYGDSTWKVQMNGTEAISHTEFQVHDSQPIPMPFRLIGYHGFLVCEHQLPVCCTVVYMHPRAGRQDPSLYEYEFKNGHAFRLRYTVLRLIDLDGQAVLALQQPGLMPFTPLMRRPETMTAAQWLRECIDATTSLPIVTEHRHDLMAVLRIFSKISYDDALIAASISRDMMQQSDFLAQYVEEEIRPIREKIRVEERERARVEADVEAERAREQVFQQGEKNGAIETILGFLGVRFHPTAVRTLKPLLETIEDPGQLKQLGAAAAEAQSLEMFLESLGEHMQ